jgi:hypothetical protein
MDSFCAVSCAWCNSPPVAADLRLRALCRNFFRPILLCRPCLGGALLRRCNSYSSLPSIRVLRRNCASVSCRCCFPIPRRWRISRYSANVVRRPKGIFAASSAASPLSAVPNISAAGSFWPPAAAACRDSVPWSSRKSSTSSSAALFLFAIIHAAAFGLARTLFVHFA